ncbi:MAG: tRNA pseudouridine(55) synthase TruB, partial [Gemmatimonadaceae bacterium]
MRSRSRDGLLLADKPAGMTSHDAVMAARRALGERKIGHAGTLDPFASGLLVLLTGRATRLLSYLDGEPKVYDASIRFGSETETDDLTGDVTRSAPPPEPGAVRGAMGALTGYIEQVPPQYSAKKVAGRRSYDAARRGQSLPLAAARVFVHEWIIREERPDEWLVTIVCGGGTYVRALARDLGRGAASAAHLTALRRVRSGRFDVRDAVPVADLDDRAAGALRSPLSGLDLPIDRLDDEGVARVVRGLPVPARVAGVRAALVDEEASLVAIADRRGAGALTAEGDA